MFGIEIDAMNFDDALRAIVDAGSRRTKGLVVTPNVDHIVTLSENPEFVDLYRKALFVFADGAPVVWFSRFRKRTYLPERVTGADLFPAICAAAAKSGLSVAFLGGMPGVAEQAADILKAKLPGLSVAGTYSPPFGFEKDSVECERIVEMINDWKPDFLFVGVGAPKQEIWSNRYLDRIDVGPVLCVGAAFDFVAGTVQRAPRWMQRIGFEWVWRVLSEPRRLAKRYLVRDIRFVPLAIKDFTGK